MDTDYLRDLADLVLRLLHVVAGIAWIGASFYFIRLDLGLRPPEDGADAERGVAGEYWGVHGGGFYHSQKYKVAPPQLPERLSQISNLKAREKVHTRMIKQYGVGSNYLQFLAEKTGGRLYKAEDLSDVPQAFDAITDELGRQYSLGYYPSGHVQPGEKREIKVRTRSANLVVRARESYVASATASRLPGQD